jgi:hypothetical protein
LSSRYTDWPILVPIWVKNITIYLIKLICWEIN